MRKINYLSLIFFIVLIELLGSVGGIFSGRSINTWYANLAKPVFNPPNWIFAPVWFALFLLMGISVYFIYSKKVKREKEKQTALKLFALHFIFNILWSYLFFALRSPFYALFDIILLLLILSLVILFFQKIDKTAAWLLLPYFIWVSFASYLNLSIYLLNR